MHRTMLFAAASVLATGISAIGAAQTEPATPALRQGETADVLFVATVPGSSEKDETGKPALVSLDPIAFVTHGELRNCAEVPKKPDDSPVPKVVLNTLAGMYSPGHRYTLWHEGVPRGMVESVKSCIDGDGDDILDFNGCFKLSGKDGPPVGPAGFKGLVFTGDALQPSHDGMRKAASSEERAAFLEVAAGEYKLHSVRVLPDAIHSSAIQRIQLRAGATALVGSTLVQLASKTPKTYYSYRLFLVVEDRDGARAPVARHFRRATLPIESDSYAPKAGQLLDEEGDVDRELFVDAIPLFRGEPDAIITEHTYYESWAYSVYRWVNDQYRLVYTGCGGGV